MIKKKCHEALIEPNDVSLIFSYEVPKNCIRRVPHVVESIKNSPSILYIMKVLEEILKGHRISDFSREWIRNSGRDDDTIRASYKVLKRIGVSDKKIVTHAYLLSRDPENIEKNYQKLCILGVNRNKIAIHPDLLSRNPETIERNYQKLSSLGLSDSKIRSRAELLARNPENIERNYQALRDLGLSEKNITSQA